MGKRQPLQWCRELHYLNRDSVKTIAKPKTLLHTFPGHYVRTQMKDEQQQQEKHQQQQQQHEQQQQKPPPHFPPSHDTEIDIVPESVLPPPSFFKHNLTSVNLVPSNLANTKLLPRGLIALASFPGSGNTWLRYLLQQATGK